MKNTYDEVSLILVNLKTVSMKKTCQVTNTINETLFLKKRFFLIHRTLGNKTSVITHVLLIARTFLSPAIDGEMFAVISILLVCLI